MKKIIIISILLNLKTNTEINSFDNKNFDNYRKLYINSFLCLNLEEIKNCFEQKLKFDEEKFKEHCSNSYGNNNIEAKITYCNLIKKNIAFFLKTIENISEENLKRLPKILSNEYNEELKRVKEELKTII